jgi:hypothetical protein
MNDEATPAKVRLSAGLGPLVEAQMAEYMAGRYIKAGDARESLWEFARLVQAAERERVADLQQQLADEQRQHAITRGELERTRLVRDEALRAQESLTLLAQRVAKYPANVDRADTLLRHDVLRAAGPRETWKA